MRLGHSVRNARGVKIHTKSQIPYKLGIQSIIFLEQNCYISLRSTSSRNSNTLIMARKTVHGKTTYQ